MSRIKIKRVKKSKPRPRGRAAMHYETMTRRQPLDNLRLMARMAGIKRKEAELEASRVKAHEEAVHAAAEAIQRGAGKAPGQTEDESCE
jgi:hypothetical protein